jgi:predicted transcriptional regulator
MVHWKTTSCGLCGTLTLRFFRPRFSNELAYTSVATVLTRLLDKGLVCREPDGRAFRYRPALQEGELAAQRIAVILSHTNDRRGALAGFVNGLGKRDTATLRALLDSDRV